MIPPYIAAFYAGLNGLILLWLIAMVLRRRFALGVSLGDGGDEGLNRTIRGHANAAETIPIALILLAFAELMDAPAVALHVAGAAFTAGRLAHGLRFNGVGPAWFRQAGMALTLLVIALLASGVVGLALNWMTR